MGKFGSSEKCESVDKGEPGARMASIESLAAGAGLTADPAAILALARAVAQACADLCMAYASKGDKHWVPPSTAGTVARELAAEIRTSFHCDDVHDGAVPSGPAAREFSKQIALRCASLCSCAQPMGEGDEVPEHHVAAVGDALAALIVEHFECWREVAPSDARSDWWARTGALMTVRDQVLASDDIEEALPHRWEHLSYRWGHLFVARLTELDPRITTEDGYDIATQHFDEGRSLAAEPWRVASSWFARNSGKRQTSA